MIFDKLMVFNDFIVQQLESFVCSYKQIKYIGGILGNTLLLSAACRDPCSSADADF